MKPPYQDAGSVSMPPGPARLGSDPPDNTPEDYSRSSPAEAEISLTVEDLGQGTFKPVLGGVPTLVRHALNGDANRATIEVALDTEHIDTHSSIGSRHLAHVLAEFDPDARVRISQLVTGANNDWPLFEGVPDVANAVWHESEQFLSFECVSLAEDRLRHALEAQITGAPMRRNRMADWDADNPDTRIVPAVQLIFNAEGKPNCSGAWYSFPVRVTTYGQAFHPTCPVFTDPDDHTAVHWTAARALAVLLTFFCPPDVDWVDLLADLMPLRFLEDVHGGDPFVETFSARLPDLMATSMNLMEALVVVGERAGIHFDKRLSNVAGTWVHWLNAFPDLYSTGGGMRRMRMPQVLDVPRDAPFTPVGTRGPADVAADDAAAQASLTVDHRCVNYPIALGEDKLYEITVELLPGWRPFPALDNGYYHYDNDNQELGPLFSDVLVGVPSVPVLDNVTQEPDDIEAANEFWAALFDEALDMSNEATQQNPATQFHREHPQHALVNDVGRRWILGEGYRFTQRDTKADGTVYGERSLWHREGYDAFYSGTDYPWDSPPDLPLLIGMSGAEWWAARPRLLLPPLAYDEAGNQYPVVVEMRIEGYTDWFKVEAQVLPDVGGILLTEPNPADIAGTDVNGDAAYYLLGLIELKAQVRVTCTIEGDDRLTKSKFAPDTLQAPMAQVFDDRSYKCEERTISSQLALVSARRHYPWLLGTVVLPGEPRDHGQALTKRVDQLAERLARSTVAGTPELFYVDYQARPGDLVDQAAGLGLSFSPGSAIQAVEWTLGRGARRTRWLISDEREEGGG